MSQKEIIICIIRNKIIIHPIFLCTSEYIYKNLYILYNLHILFYSVNMNILKITFIEHESLKLEKEM